MPHWIQEHETLLWWMTSISLVTFVLSFVSLPFLVALIPSDYFAHEKRKPKRATFRHPVFQYSMAILKNVLGFIFVLVGIAMLALPGQGVITILIGLMLMNFPGKFRLERWLIQQPAVQRGVNWLRAKANRPALEVPAPSQANEPKSPAGSKK